MRWGIAGHGDVVSRRVLPALRALGQDPVFLYGRDTKRTATAAEQWGITASSSDPLDLLTDTDAVYVATPVARHVPLAAAALDAGLPVLIEKPLAGSLRPGGSALATERACAGVAYYRRLAPIVREIRRELTGWSPERVELRFRCAFNPGPGHPMRWRTDWTVSGGGVLADAGSHRLDLLLMLFGPPVEVSARLDRRFAGGAERVATVELVWATGVRAHCSVEWRDGPPVDVLSFHGGGRSLVLNQLDSGELRATGPGGVRRILRPPDANPHLPLVADFVTAVADERPPVCPVAEAVLVDDVIVAANRSDALGGAPVRPWPP
ncbi:Gfo/Idh/MocA family protein [Streptomyces sp. NPDC058576]|uniref:Gfo/Idh/MocA family protein n=1 Tax=Streptomyces sp. NPDC058576 TaxID=3346547 RepID=UPI0036518DEB